MTLTEKQRSSTIRVSCRVLVTQPLIRRPRQLWNQVLSNYREVAATALTVKAGTNALDMVRKVLSWDPASLQSASVDDLRAHHTHVMSLSTMKETIRQLGCGKDVPGAQEGHDSLESGRLQLLEFATKLCPNFDEMVAELRSWADSQAPIDLATADVATTANACPREALQLPERFDRGKAGGFLFRCHLTVQSPIQCVIRSGHTCPNQPPLQGSCYSH